MVIKCTLLNVEYVLQSETKLLAYGSNMQKVSQMFKHILVQNKIADLNTIELKNCKIGDENLHTFIPYMTVESLNLYLIVLDISHCKLTGSCLNMHISGNP